jgi:predicted DNA-binding transcriptional regulator YafY
MKLLEQLQTLQRLDRLVRLKATGSPKILATKLDVSERTIYNLIDGLRELGATIEYCKHRQSYYYNGSFSIRFVVCTAENGEQIIGGEKKINFFSLLQNFCSNDL